MKETIRSSVGLLDCRIHILIALLTLASCHTVSGADRLVTRCDGPEGYCSEGSNFIISYVSGGDVQAPPIIAPGLAGVPFIEVGYCPKIGTMAGRGCIPIKKSAIDTYKLQIGGWRWSEYTGFVTGVYPVPRVPQSANSNTEYCVAAWVATFNRSAGIGNDWLSFGESQRYDGELTPCSGIAPSPPPPDLCYLNSGNPISVDFGQVERSGIGANRDGTSGISKSISVKCLGTSVHTLNVSLNMNPTSWSDSQISTSNTALGVAIIHSGKEMKNNDSFEMRVQGSSTQSLGFSLLHNPSKSTKEVATGPFQASATLIVTEP